MNIVKGIVFATAVVMLSGCQTAVHHADAVRAAIDGTALSAGVVQREIRAGMTSAEVVQVLGSPNIVTSDDQRREVWVYDRIATDRVYSTSSGGVSSLILGFGSQLGAGGGLGFNQAAGASSVSQRSLTVIIKFDAAGRVRDFAYHQAKF